MNFEFKQLSAIIAALEHYSQHLRAINADSTQSEDLRADAGNDALYVDTLLQELLTEKAKPFSK